MKTFKQFIKETFDSQYKYQDHGYDDDQARHTYEFKTKGRKDKMTVHFNHEDDGEVEVGFRDKEDNFEATGNKGTEAIKVFSTVHKIMKDHAAQHPKIKRYRFVGSEGTRSRLYDRLAKKAGGTSEDGLLGYREYTVPAGSFRDKKKKK